MRSTTKQALPGLTGTLRVAPKPGATPLKVRRGDVAVVNDAELDRVAAQALLDAGVVAVVNAQPMVSNRYPNLGPELLADAGVLLLEDVGESGVAALGDGRQVRIIDDGTIYDGELRLAEGRVIGADEIRLQMDAVRIGMLAHLETFTHTTAELLRREQEVLLHAVGVPQLTKASGRPIVVAAPGAELEGQLRRMKRFIREQKPVVVAVGAAADGVRRAGLRADVIVVSASDELPMAKTLKMARDVVVCAPAGSAAAVEDGLMRIGIRGRRFDSTLTPTDAGLLVAAAAKPRVIIGAGMRITLSDLLDRARHGLASGYLTRLAVGGRLVDADSVPTLYSGRVTARHVLVALVLCVVMVAAAIATTDVGQDWMHDLGHHVGDLVDRITG